MPWGFPGLPGGSPGLLGAPQGSLGFPQFPRGSPASPPGFPWRRGSMQRRWGRADLFFREIKYVGRFRTPLILIQWGTKTTDICVRPGNHANEVWDIFFGFLLILIFFGCFFGASGCRAKRQPIRAPPMAPKNKGHVCSSSCTKELSQRAVQL